ncbi:MAG: polyamine aminopropyltransferase, partial [Candidatus Accumulibacter sp.]|nr:polyamine aminopropyltransferase [Accumulibacter sp.]
YDVKTRFLTEGTTQALFQFPKDMARVESEVNRLDNQVLVHTFEDEWREVLR